MALFDDPLVFVDFQHVQCGQLALGWVGQVGGDGVEPVEFGCGGEGFGVAAPVDGGFAGGVGAGGDRQQGRDAGADELGDAVLDLLAGLVVAPAEAVADAAQPVLGLGQGAFAGLGDGGGFLAGPDVGHPQPVAAGDLGVGVGDLDLAQQAPVAGALGAGVAVVRVGRSGRGR